MGCRRSSNEKRRLVPPFLFMSNQNLLLLLFRSLLLLRSQRQGISLPIMIRCYHCTLLYFSFEDLFSDRVFKIFLNGTVQRTRSELMVISFLGKEILCLVCKLDLITQGRDASEKFAQCDIDDLVDILALQRVEDYHIIKTIEELRAECTLQRILNR